jgi:HEAT repeat protein
MASINAKLDHLRRLRRPVREAAWLAALRVATTHEADALVAEILEHHRQSPEWGLLSRILARWRDLTPEARRATVAGAGDRLADVLGALAPESDGPDARRVPIHVLADIVEGRVTGPKAIAPLALAALSRLKPDDLADTGAVEALAVVAAALDGSDPPEPSLAAALDRALAASAGRFESHRSSLLMDVILARATHPGPELAAWLADESEPGHLALRAAVRRLSRDQAARRVVSLLGVPALAGACLERLEKLDEPGLQTHLMLDAPLLMTRGRGAAVRRMSRPEAVLPRPEALRDMPARARLGYVRWVRTLALHPERRLERLAIAAGDADPRVRLDAARAIAALEPTPRADEALAQLAADADPRVATVAAGALASARSEHRLASIGEMVAPLRHSAHESVRKTVTALLQRTPRIGPDGRARYADPLTVRRALLRAREETIANIKAQISGADRADRMAAIEFVARFGLLGMCRSELLEAARSPDPYVAAKAARALSGLGDAVTRRQLAKLVEHKDPRVGADAIEALASAGDAGRLALDALAEHPVARIRANALHAMLRTGPRGIVARAGLAEMLADERPDHRRSALWLAQRSAVTEMADRVAQIVRSDPDEPTRARARRCGRRLLAEMRRAWSHPAGAPEGAS